jgi:hypothetical protein
LLLAAAKRIIGIADFDSIRLWVFYCFLFIMLSIFKSSCDRPKNKRNIREGTSTHTPTRSENKGMEAQTKKLAPHERAVTRVYFAILI